MSQSSIKGSFLDDLDSFLRQYGVKGMRWGYRKDRSGKRRPTKEVLKEQKRNRNSNQNRSKTNEKTRSKSISQMSDAELNQRLNRMRLEQTYAQMTAPAAKPPKSRVQKMMGDITYDVTRGAVTEVGKAVLSAYLRREISKRTNLNLGKDKK